MNFLSIMDEHIENYGEIPSVLLSGKDQLTKERMIQRWLDAIQQDKSPHIVIDMSKMRSVAEIITKSGVTVGAIIPGNNVFSMFDGDRIESEDRLKISMSNSGWNEEKKDKAIAYLNLLQHIYKMEYGENGKINLQLIAMYSAPKVVEYKMNQLVNAGILDFEEQLNILGRYSELSSVAPDIENLLISHSTVSGITMGEKIRLADMINNKVLYVHLGRVKDVVSKKTILEMVSNMVMDYVQSFVSKGMEVRKPYVTVYSRGNKTDSVLGEFFENIHEFSQILFISDNVFAIDNYSYISQCFPMRIYSRHDTMEGCEEVEKCFGNIYVRKKTYSSARDMHHKSRGFLDRILGTDRVLTENISDQRPEAKYRKEDIAVMPEGYCILSYAGRDFIACI